MIVNIRNYFNDRIIECDPDLEAWECDVFGNNSQTNPRASRYYNLVIGSTTPFRNGTDHGNDVSVSLDLFTSQAGQVLPEFDALYDKALQIKNTLIFKQNYNQIFNDIEAINIEPIEEDGNDNSFRIRLEFIIRERFSIKAITI